MNFNLNIQRELPGQMILQVGYVGSMGRHLEIAYEGNPITPAGQAACAASSSCISNRLLQSVIYPSHTEYAPGDIFASVGTQATAGVSSYHSLQVNLNKRLSHGLFFAASYTYSHAIDDTSGFENSSFGTRGTDPYNFGIDKGDSAYDARHRFVTNYDYELPSLGRFWNNGFVTHVVDGWTVSGITTFQTGFPLVLADSSYRSLLCNGADFSFYGCPDGVNYVGPGSPTSLNPRNSIQSKTASTPNHEFVTLLLVQSEPVHACCLRIDRK